MIRIVSYGTSWLEYGGSVNDDGSINTIIQIKDRSGIYEGFGIGFTGLIVGEEYSVDFDVVVSGWATGTSKIGYAIVNDPSSNFSGYYSSKWSGAVIEKTSASQHIIINHVASSDKMYLEIGHNMEGTTFEMSNFKLTAQV